MDTNHYIFIFIESELCPDIEKKYLKITDVRGSVELCHVLFKKYLIGDIHV